MIVKLFNLTKDLNKKINFFLLYGKNVGHIEDTINNVLKPNFSKNVFYKGTFKDDNIHGKGILYYDSDLKRIFEYQTIY